MYANMIESNIYTVGFNKENMLKKQQCKQYGYFCILLLLLPLHKKKNIHKNICEKTSLIFCWVALILIPFNAVTTDLFNILIVIICSLLLHHKTSNLLFHQPLIEY